MMRWLGGSAVLLFLCGCSTGLELQHSYEDDRNACQGEAESRYYASGAHKPDNSALVKIFNACMSAKGWDMGSAPPPAPPAAVQQPGLPRPAPDKDVILRAPHEGMFPYEEY